MNTLHPDSHTARYWRWARRLLVGIAVVVTLVAVFYSVENWRGKRAWDNCRRQLEARGEVLDWAAYVPPPVPDDQNLFKAPGISEWFVQDSSGSGLSADISGKQWPFRYPKVPGTNRLLLAEVRISTPSAPLEAKAGEIVVQWDAAGARKRIAEILDQVAGPRALGPVAQLFLQRSPEAIKPGRLLVQAESNLVHEELDTLLSAKQPPDPRAKDSPGSTSVQLASEGALIRVWMNGPCHAAAEFLAATESYTNAFEIIRRAFERPYGRIDGDYKNPLLVPHPNWGAIRNMAQSLCGRAQCHLLLGKLETAWDELNLAWELHRLSEANPPGKPMMVVGAMVNAAMVGLHACTIQDGLRLHAWREPELLAIEREIKNADLLSDATHAWRIERASSPEVYQITWHRDLQESTCLGERVAAFARSLAPRGWQYQKLAVSAEVTQAALDSVDSTNQLVAPHRFGDALQKLRSRLKCSSSKIPWVPALAPNLERTLLATAHKQTIVNLARIACMLERYRVAHEQYPATLDELAADLKEQLPHDIINGQPFRYRSDPSGQYIMYSVGWNEKDDGATPGKSIEEGDWVWESAPKRP